LVGYIVHQLVPRVRTAEETSLELGALEATQDFTER
jgi:hypothetical protein